MALAHRKMSLDEFLAWENEQPDRHEYYQGEVFAMVGGRRTHGRVVLNLARRLGERLEVVEWCHTLLDVRSAQCVG